MIHKYKAFLKASHEMASLKTEQIYNVTEIDFKSNHVTIEDNKGMIDVAFMKDVELLQFTGLKDKNGVEIYLGDILENIYGDRSFVVYYDSSACFRMNGYYGGGIDFHRQENEVIGNIHTSPELLNS